MYGHVDLCCIGETACCSWTLMHRCATRAARILPQARRWLPAAARGHVRPYFGWPATSSKFAPHRLRPAAQRRARVRAQCMWPPDLAVTPTRAHNACGRPPGAHACKQTLFCIPRPLDGALAYLGGWLHYSGMPSSLREPHFQLISRHTLHARSLVTCACAAAPRPTYAGWVYSVPHPVHVCLDVLPLLHPAP